MKIESVSGILISSPYGNGKVLGQSKGVKSIGLLQVRTDLGFSGYGETYAGIYVPEMVPIIAQQINDFVQGMEIHNPCSILSKCYIPFISRNGIYASVYGAFEIALWDIISQSEQIPLHLVLQKHFSTFPDQVLDHKTQIKSYYSGGSAAFSFPEIREDINHSKKREFSAYKMRVGTKSLNEDLERVMFARRELGDANLMVDAIMGTLNPPWVFSQAKEFLTAIAPLNLTWLEEPLPPTDLVGMSNLKAESSTPIAAGEALTGMLELAAYTMQNAVDVLQLDVTHCGGFAIAFAAAQAAAEKGVTLSMHVWGSACAQSANIAFALACPYVEWFEFPSVSLQVNKEITHFPLCFRNGNCLAPLHPGLGIHLNQLVIERYPFISGSGFTLPRQ
jgi:L-alanine-DL-glutamate epimerase-like enolase superfamily enzyme